MAFLEGEELKPRKLYTGLGDVNVVMVNPTLAEMQEHGINYKEEPVYTSVSDEGVKKVRLDIWVDNPIVGLQKIAFFLANESKPSAAGNIQFINDYGQASWAVTKEDLLEKASTWYKDENIRPALTGEPELVDFIKNLLSIGKDGVAKIDYPEKLINGDVSELKDIFTRFSTRKVQVLYIVKQSGDNWYQNIYTRYFSRSGMKSTTYWTKHMNNNTSRPMFQDTWTLKEFDPLNYSSPSASDSSDTDPWA